MKPALLLIDLQKDFCSGGALAVPNADQIIPIANKLQTQFDHIIATQDWHPADHQSFASNHANKSPGDCIMLGNVEQILWPAHCIQQTDGAKFHEKLDTSRISKIIYKGTNPLIDSYSAFFDNAHLQQTELANYLLKCNIKDLYILGLATNYCVKYSCLDAVKLGFNVHLYPDACRGIEMQPGDVARALQTMHDAGVKMLSQ